MRQGSNWSRRDLVGASAGVGLAALVGGSTFAGPALARVSGARTARPNILFIMADDLGYADLSCYGRRDYQTPRLDGLAEQGLKLTQGYANSSVCSATRTALLTGRYQYRYRAGLDEPIGVDPSVGMPAGIQTMPVAFRKLGYRTSLIGKWHLGSQPQSSPLRLGYDRFYGILGGGTDYFNYSRLGRDMMLRDNDHPVDSNAYLTDMLTERALTEIRSRASNAAPFFMSLHFTAPHWPWEGPEDRARAEALTDIFDRDGGSIATYARMVRNLDANIGRILDALVETKQADNTIVVFTSDNGGDRFSDMWPFIGVKTELLEGGIRVPLIVRWPGQIAPGSTSEQVMISMDFMPTLLAAAGVTDVTGLKLDGEDLLPTLLGKAAVRPRRLFWRYKARGQEAVRDGRWKYLKLDEKEHLFDLEADQRERADLKKRHPEKFEQLRKEFASWNATMLPYPADSFSYDGREFFVDR